MGNEDAEKHQQIITQLQASLEQARQAGIPQTDITQLIASVFNVAESKETPEDMNSKDQDSLRNRLAQIKPEDLPKMPPLMTFSDGTTNTFAMPDEVTIKKLSEIIPDISSVICDGFQQAAFAVERSTNGFRGTPIFGYNTDYFINRKSNLRNTELNQALLDLEEAEKKKAKIIYMSIGEESRNRRRLDGSNVFIVTDENNPNAVQLIVKRAEGTSYAGYPSYAIPDHTRTTPDPMLITFTNPIAAEKFKSLLAENPFRTLHTLTALIFHPDVIDLGPSIDTKSKDYLEGVSGFMYIPGGGGKTPPVLGTL